MISVYLAITDEDQGNNTCTALISGLPIYQIDKFIDAMQESLLPDGAKVQFDQGEVDKLDSTPSHTPVREED